MLQGEEREDWMNWEDEMENRRKRKGGVEGMNWEDEMEDRRKREGRVDRINCR